VTCRQAITTRLGMALLWISCLLPQGGCRKEPDLTQLASQKQTSSEEEDLAQAISLIGRLDTEPFGQIQPLLIFHLNRWIENQSHDPQWILEPLLNRPLFLSIDDHPPLEQLMFHLSDVFYLQETSWLHSIAEWVDKQDQREHLKRFADLLPAGLSKEDRAQLNTTCRLFDWSVRNLQLQPLLAYPTTGSGENLRERNVAPRLGDDGPGYMQIPHDVLSYGSGDAWQRGRIFIQLARQRQIQVVYLGIRADKKRRTQPWLTAAMIGEHLYLFDNQLGLPLLAGGGTRIATLADLKDDPTVLESLAIDGQPYRVKQADLEDVVAMVDACHCAISQRMMTLEKHLAGENQMVLSVTPGRISRRLRSVFDIDYTELLPTSMETFLFKVGRQQRQESPGNPQNLADARKKFLLTTSSSKLVQGRRLFMRGQFGDSTLTRSGQGARNAKTLLLSSRMSDEGIESILTSAETQKLVGLVRLQTDSDEVWRQKVESAYFVAEESKKHATFWISMIHMEEGNYIAAINWLEKRTLATDDPGPFDHLAQYNLARCFEATGQLEKAREILLQSSSTQSRGDHLLAKRLSAQP
jgi:hypothetical protein